MSLTAHLMSCFPDSYVRASQHPFLQAAGARTLEMERLSTWITQDFFYVNAYVKLIGLLMARVEQAPVTLHKRAFGLFANALQNITTEIAFFEDVVKRHGLNSSVVPKEALKEALANGEKMTRAYHLIEPNTKSYVDFMIATGSVGAFEDGLVLLWATEKCYLDAWTYAAQQPKAAEGSPASEALDELIKNWTSKEFHAFVEDLGQLVDDLGIPISAVSSQLQDVEGIMRRVLYLEERFWPE